jgi:hypothetical protein
MFSYFFLKLSLWTCEIMLQKLYLRTVSPSNGKEVIRTTHAPQSLQPNTKLDHPNPETLYCLSSTIF